MDSFFTDHFGILLERAERLRRISTRGEYRLAEHDLKTINELRSTMIAFEKRLGEAEKSVRKGICNYLLREDKKRGMKLHGYDLSPGRKQRAGEEREIGNGF